MTEEEAIYNRAYQRGFAAGQNAGYAKVFHWTPEGCAFNSGWNFYWTRTGWKFWLRVVYASVALSNETAYIYYLRFRPYMWPWFIWERTQHNIIENYHACRRMVTISRMSYEDIPEEYKPKPVFPFRESGGGI